MVDERKFRSVSLNSDLVEAVEETIKKKTQEVGEALLPIDFKSSAAFIAESARQRLALLKKQGA